MFQRSMRKNLATLLQSLRRARVALALLLFAGCMKGTLETTPTESLRADYFLTVNTVSSVVVSTTCSVVFSLQSDPLKTVTFDDNEDVVTCGNVAMAHNATTYFKTASYVSGASFQIILIRRGQTNIIAAPTLSNLSGSIDLQ